MKKCRLSNNTAVDVTTGNIEEMFHPNLQVEFVDCPNEVENGWKFDGVNWSAPPPPVVIPVDAAIINRNISKLEYMNRFTDAELEAIYTAAKSSVSVEIWLEKFKLATFIDLSDPLIAEGLAKLETVGLIAVGRAAEILE